MMGVLVRRTVEQSGKARFLVVDHGCQFRTRFRTYVENTLGITPVSGKVRTYTFNGKAERFFRTFKGWTRLVLFALLGNKKAMTGSIQKHLERYRSWFNCIRVHQGIGGQTPEQAWSRAGLPAAKIVRSRYPQPGFLVSRRTFEDDPHLPVVNIEVEWAEAA
jgi:transposase InsO family protein